MSGNTEFSTEIKITREIEIFSLSAHKERADVESHTLAL